MRAAIALLLSVLVGCAGSSPKPCVTGCDHALRIAGTFSDLHVVDGVGFFGTEIRVAPTHEPYFQVVVQFGSCQFAPLEQRGAEPCFRESNLILVDAATESDTRLDKLGALEFTIPATSPYAGTFSGVIGCDDLTGEFKFASGKLLTVRLKRDLPYWER